MTINAECYIQSRSWKGEPIHVNMYLIDFHVFQFSHSNVFDGVMIYNIHSNVTHINISCKPLLIMLLVVICKCGLLHLYRFINEIGMSCMLTFSSVVNLVCFRLIKHVKVCPDYFLRFRFWGTLNTLIKAYQMSTIQSYLVSRFKTSAGSPNALVRHQKISTATVTTTVWVLGVYGESKGSN
jgi:hypothetical protein